MRCKACDAYIETNKEDLCSTCLGLIPKVKSLEMLLEIDEEELEWLEKLLDK